MRAPGTGRILALSILIVTVSTQAVFLLGAGFLQTGPEFGFGVSGLGLLTGLYFVAASIASAPLGRLVERIGWRRAMRANALATAAITLLIAAVAHNVWVLGLLLMAAAVAYGLANPAANQAIAQFVKPTRRATMFGLKHAGIPASTLIAGLAVPAIIIQVGWRAAYVSAAILAMLVVALIPRGPAAPAAPAAPADENARRYVAPLTTPMLAALGAAAALGATSAVALSTYLVAAAVDVGFTEPSAGLLLFAGSLASIVARVTSGAVTDRIGGKGFGGFAVLTGAGTLVFFALTGATGPAFAILVVAAFSTGWAWPGLMTYTVVNANAPSAASSSAVAQAGVFVGVAIAPPAIGLIADRAGFDAVWVVVAVCLAVATALVAAIGRLAIKRTAHVVGTAEDRRLGS